MDIEYSFVKGNFLPANQAKISITERGFRFGDGVFETIYIHNAKPYQWALHLKRLKQGLAELKINTDLSKLERNSLLLIKKNNITKGFLRISVSRGIGSIGYLPTSKKATIIIETVKVKKIDKAAKTLAISQYQKLPLASLPTNSKLMQGVGSTLARLEAQEKGVFDVLLLGDKGQVCETSSANIFWYKKGKLYTPSLDSSIVEGTTRAAVARLSPYPVIEGNYKLKDLKGAEEVFICNVAWGIMPIKEIQSVEKYQKTTITGQLAQLLQQDKS
jgi:aminodeoxychorismate lyase